MKIIIAGGGIGGLTLASALRAAPFESPVQVTVLERRSLDGMLSGPGGIFIQKNAMRVFETLGDGRLARQLYAAGGLVLCGGFFSQRFKPLYVNTPSFASEKDLGVALRRPVLQRLLYEALPAELVRPESGIASFRQEGETVVVKLESGEELQADLLVGADGLRSRVRAELREQLAGDRTASPAAGTGVRQPPSDVPIYSGQTCWRGIFDRSRVALDSRYTWGELWGVGSRFGYFDSGGGTGCFYAFVNEAAGGKDPKGALPALRQRFAGYASPVPDILASLDESKVYRDDIFDRDPPGSVWGHGSVTLLGDAAHATQPTLGQGGCMAIEDAFELSRMLANGARTQLPLVERLRRYEAERTPRVSRVILESRKVSELANTDKPLLAWLRNVIYKLTPVSVGDRQFRWLFDYQPTW